MKYSEKEIINALNIIKDICREQHNENGCKDCPFSDEQYYCLIQVGYPFLWTIAVPTTFKALHK